MFASLMCCHLSVQLEKSCYVVMTRVPVLPKRRASLIWIRMGFFLSIYGLCDIVTCWASFFRKRHLRFPLLFASPKKKFFFDESSIIHLTGIKSPSVIREAIVSGDSLLEPGGGVFWLTSNSPLNKFLETLRESVHPIVVFNTLINNIYHSSHDPSFNVSPLLLLCESPL